MRLSFAACLLASLALLAPASRAQCELARFVSPLAIDNDSFGWQVALSGRDAWVVDTRGPNAGIHFAEEGPQGWALTGSLITNEFHQAIAIEGERGVAVSEGRATIFARVGGDWVVTDTLFPSDNLAGGGFVAIELAGDQLVLGAPSRRTTFGPDSGKIYVFDWTGSGWAESEAFPAFDGVPHAAFGASLEVSGDTLMVGSPLRDEGGVHRAGVVYVFDRASGVYVREQRLLSSSPTMFQDFGGGISIEGNHALIAARGTPNQGGTTGAAYLFQRQAAGWVEVQRIEPQRRTIGFAYQGDVVLQRDRALVGAYLGGGTSQPGSVHVYRRTAAGLEFSRELIGDRRFGTFARSMAADGDRVLVGGEGLGDLGCVGGAGPECDTGAALLFELPPGTTEPTVYCDAIPSSAGVAVRLVLTGCTGVAQNGMRLSASPLPGGEGLFFFGDRAANPIPFGDGFRCVNGPTRRVSAPTVEGPFQELAVELDLTSAPAAGLLVAGSTWAFQALYRDTTPAGFNLSDAIELTFLP